MALDKRWALCDTSPSEVVTRIMMVMIMMVMMMVVMAMRMVMVLMIVIIAHSFPTQFLHGPGQKMGALRYFSQRSGDEDHDGDDNDGDDDGGDGHAYGDGAYDRYHCA
eukprot:TRINITY_DN11976_c0_g1_i1.p2 TRINITY_DN11976_c0_g1~~TRINITY_DN11976_c0_g1_i1.p2  ORF type:complete len:108 (-),score=11.90 TRINITY_DN11976_c0_g1_i1:44-367(-)